MDKVSVNDKILIGNPKKREKIEIKEIFL